MVPNTPPCLSTPVADEDAPLQAPSGVDTRSEGAYKLNDYYHLDDSLGTL